MNFHMRIRAFQLDEFELQETDAEVVESTIAAAEFLRSNSALETKPNTKDEMGDI